MTQCIENHYFSGMVSKIRQQFEERYGKQALVAAAPGRVNLIGEHTDYNQGFVLPGAVAKRIYVAMAPNLTQTLNLYANQYKAHFSFRMDDIHPVTGWPTYLLGMIHQFQKKGKVMGGMDICVDGDVPLGAGMSSSAALCSAFGFVMNEWYHWGLSKMELALAGQKTEHEFAGVQCGIMDQFASLHGKAGHVIKLDCRSMDYEYIPFDFPAYKIVLINTMVSHSLAGTEYNIRRAQCEEGVSILQKYFPNIKSLRDVNMDQLEKHQQEIPQIVYRRCHFIIDENNRLLQGCGFLSKADLESFGQLMFLAHEGLSRDYEVSCPESDFLVEKAKSFEGVVGSRQMGGGFGGCTINIVRNDRVENFIEHIQAAYEQQFYKIPEAYITEIEEGAKIISD
jgi:galactokinase